ncbi:hypothetical protein ACFQ3P_40255 [Paraburkholderia sabiae]|uniref:hypothetical protein n=1 Tax=Paraburkholderia sabiae TaxID=273251 RepID=UPI0019190DF0|nr:hypothetical protein [Paraburkholderia sabiae]
MSTVAGSVDHNACSSTPLLPAINSDLGFARVASSADIRELHTPLVVRQRFRSSQRIRSFRLTSHPPLAAISVDEVDQWITSCRVLSSSHCPERARANSFPAGFVPFTSAFYTALFISIYPTAFVVYTSEIVMSSLRQSIRDRVTKASRSPLVLGRHELRNALCSVVNRSVFAGMPMVRPMAEQVLSEDKRSQFTSLVRSRSISRGRSRMRASYGSGALPKSSREFRIEGYDKRKQLSKAVRFFA